MSNTHFSDHSKELLLARFEPEVAQLQSLEYCAKKQEVPIGFLINIAKAFDDYSVLKHLDFSSYNIRTIVHYLKKTHDHYRSNILPTIFSAIERAQKNTSQFAVLGLIDDFLKLFAKDLEEHFLVEEHGLFPYALQLNQVNSTHDYQLFNRLKPIELDHFDDIHQHMDEELKLLRMAIRERTPNEEGTVHQILNQLKDFEVDLFIHEFLEEEVLLPRLRHQQTKWEYSNERITRKY